MKTMPATRSGWLAPRSSDRSAPRDSGTSTARPAAGASSTASPSATQSGAVAVGDPGQSLELDPLVERHHQADQRIHRVCVGLEAVLGGGLDERLGQQLAPLRVDSRDALADLGAVPAERLELEPDLRIARA